MSIQNCFLNLFRAAGLMALLMVTSALSQPLPADSLEMKEILTPKPAMIEADTLFLQDQVIAVFRASSLGYSSRERVEMMRQRINALLELENPGDAAYRLTPEGALVMIGNQGVFFITAADLDSLAGETLEEAGKRAAENLSLAFRAEREQRSFWYLLQGSALVLLTSALLIFLLWGIRRAHRYLYRRLQEVAERRMSQGTIKEINVLDANRSLTLIRRFLDGMAWLAGLLLVYIWIGFSLRRFPYTRPWGDALRDWLFSLFKQFTLGFLEAIPGLVTVVLIFLIVRFLVRLIKAFFRAVAEGRIALGLFHPDTAATTQRIVVVVLWLFAFVLAYPYLPGSDSAAFQGLSVFIGLMVSIGASGVVTQGMSGLILIYSRALKVGDYVCIGDTEGVVIFMGILSTKIQTNKREEVTISNSMMLSSNIKNYSRLAGSEGIILYTSVTIGYTVPWRQVHAMLILAAERTAGLRRQPAPFVLQSALADFYVEYQLNAYLEKPEERIRTLAALHANIQDVFNEYGVQIMSPHYEKDPPEPQIVPQDKWHPAPAQSPALLNTPSNQTAKPKRAKKEK